MLQYLVSSLSSFHLYIYNTYYMYIYIIHIICLQVKFFRNSALRKGACIYKRKDKFR